MNKKDNIQSISLTPTHGTAKQVFVSSIIPKTKEEKEVFWVKHLLDKKQKKYKKAYSNSDDSRGNHDVIIDFDKNKTGVQVTELTYELERARKNIKQKYIEKIIIGIKASNISLKDKIIVNLFFPAKDTKKPTAVEIKTVINSLINELQKFTSDVFKDLSFAKISIERAIKEEQIYVPSAGNIGFNVNFDQVPRSLPFYKEAIDNIIKKKSKSKSEWLLIWSLDFWRDKHWLEDEIIDYMKKCFSSTSFKKIYFAESMDGKGFFEANLKIEKIK